MDQNINEVNFMRYKPSVVGSVLESPAGVTDGQRPLKSNVRQSDHFNWGAKFVSFSWLSDRRMHSGLNGQEVASFDLSLEDTLLKSGARKFACGIVTVESRAYPHRLVRDYRGIVIQPCKRNVRRRH